MVAKVFRALSNVSTVGLVFSDNREKQRTIFELFFKDTCSYERQYINVVLDIIESYHFMKLKASALEPIINLIFDTTHMKADKLVMGFYFLYVYKDFILREIIHDFQRNNQKSKSFALFDSIEAETQHFIQNDLSLWMNFMLDQDVFEGYEELVPNYTLRKPEPHHYKDLLQRYILHFMSSMPFYSAMYKNKFEEAPESQIEYDQTTKSFRLQQTKDTSDLNFVAKLDEEIIRQLLCRSSSNVGKDSRNSIFFDDGDKPPI